MKQKLADLTGETQNLKNNSWQLQYPIFNNLQENCAEGKGYRKNQMTLLTD